MKEDSYNDISNANSVLQESRSNVSKKALRKEVKQLKKKLRKAEDLLNEIRSEHDVLKKNLKKKKKKNKSGKK